MFLLDLAETLFYPRDPLAEGDESVGHLVDETVCRLDLIADDGGQILYSGMKNSCVCLCAQFVLPVAGGIWS